MQPKFMPLRLNKKLYHMSAIEEAIKQYQDIAVFEISSIGQYYVISINNKEGSIDNDRLQDEFGNYVLFLMRK